MVKLKIGYGRAEITPPESVHMSGFGNDTLKFSGQVLDPLFVTCLAFSDESEEITLLFASDTLSGANWMREVVSRELGIPEERINVSGSHTHAGPCVRPERINADKLWYLDFMGERLVEAARQAIADRKPTTISVASVQTERMNFVRQYLMADGSYAGPGFGNFKQPIVAHESEADHELQLVKFTREGGKDVILANFQAHQTMTSGSRRTDLSADSCGAMRVKMERELDCHFIYFAGASGNVTPNSRIEGEGKFVSEQYVEHGEALADYAIAAEGTYRPVKAGEIRSKRMKLDLPVDHSLDHLESIARGIRDEWKRTGDGLLCSKLSHEAGLNSVYHAESIIDKLELGETYDLELNVMSIGELGFVMPDYEMYDTNGMFIKEHSPFEMTIVATCSNDYRSYLPSALAFEHGGYTVDRCRFKPGIGEEVARQYVTELNNLFKNQ